MRSQIACRVVHDAAKTSFSKAAGKTPFRMIRNVRVVLFCLPSDNVPRYITTAVGILLRVHGYHFYLFSVCLLGFFFLFSKRVAIFFCGDCRFVVN